MKAKRPYSKRFTPRTTRRVRYEVDRIPPTLMAKVKAKAKREGKSLRELTLELWTVYADPESEGVISVRTGKQWAEQAADIERTNAAEDAAGEDI